LNSHAIYTIGHSNHTIEHFIDLLKTHGVEVVADVRTTPVSSRHPQFNRDALKAALASAGIKYLFLGKELGARRSEREAYEGQIASYERIAGLPAFRDGLDRVRKGAESYSVALMCAEKDPLDCHRTVLVCRHLRDTIPGAIQHILADGSLEAHEQTERRMVADMGINVDQSEMFSDQSEPPLERAYRKRGLKIAYQEEASVAN